MMSSTRAALMPSRGMRLSDLPDDINELSRVTWDAALEVHRTVGNRLTERTYRDCLAHEMRLRGHRADVEYPLPLRYKDLVVPEAYFIDLLIDDKLVVELKATPALEPEHEAQLLTYLHMSGCRLGMLFNFHAPLLRDGFRRMVN
jgi:GxxExxY protein